jgi:hypothetical protein
MSEQPDDLFFEKLASETEPSASAPDELKAKIFHAIDARQEDTTLGQVAVEPAIERAPSRLKSRIYSALVTAQQESGALRSLSETVAKGRQLCVFEQLVQIAQLGQTPNSAFYCRVCHARILAEHFENPPIYWPHCPYVQMKNR